MPKKTQCKATLGFVRCLLPIGHRNMHAAGAFVWDEFNISTPIPFPKTELLQKPFEIMQESSEQRAMTAVRSLLEHIGEDPTREGLLETPKRVVKAWTEMTAGYRLKEKDVLGTTFDADGYDELVLLRDVEFFSCCEHHMMPFTGVAHVAYLPGKRIVGLSKLARLVDMFAKRLQVQERMTAQIAAAIEDVLKPKGVAVAVSARHFCMCARGVGKQGSSMVTSTVRGVFRAPAARAEFFSLINLNKP